ncbi:MAG TPA: helix-turn-helix transcriptional regulator [Puia sp.]|jgi:transcriptional regulator with XRE-family HTH domain
MKTKSDQLFLKKLGKRITTLRKSKGLTQVKLGEKCGMKRPSMNRIEKGKTNATFLTLRKVCKALEIDEFTLLNFK